MQEIGSPSSHSRVDVCLCGLDVVVEIIAEGFDVGDDVLSAGVCEVAGEQDCVDWLVLEQSELDKCRIGGTKSNVANLTSASYRQTWLTLELQWRVVAEQDLRGILDGSPPCIDKLLQEDLAKDAICLLPEDGAEDDGDTVVAGLDEDGLLLTVMDGLDRSSLLHTLGCAFRGVLGGFLVQGSVFVKGLLEGGSHGVPPEQAYSPDQVISGVLLGREGFEVNLDGEVVSCLGLDNVWAVLALQDCLSAVADELAEALDG